MICVGGVLALLHRDLRDARVVLAATSCRRRRRPRGGRAACSRAGTLMRLPRSISAPVCSASELASVDPFTPGRPDHGAGGMRVRRAALVLDGEPRSSTSTTFSSSQTSTPSRSSCLAAPADSLVPKSPSTMSSASTSTIRDFVGSMVRKSLRSVRRASSRDLAGHLDAGGAGADDDEGLPLVACLLVWLELGELERRRGCGRAARARRRWTSGRGRSARTRRCRSRTWWRRRRRSASRSAVTVCSPPACEVTVCASTSMPMTSPSRVRMLRWRRRISRVAGAISPSDRMPVATW